MSWLIKNAEIYDRLTEGRFDLLIEGDLIGEIAPAGKLKGDFEKEIDLAGAITGPGFVDLHTHLREPGREDAETILTGARAAVAGGYSAISPMANTSPVADNAAVVELVKAKGMQVGLCDIFPIGAVTKGLLGSELAEIGAMAASDAKVRIFSDDGKCVSNARLMRRAMEYIQTFDGFISQHAQEPELTVNSTMNESELSGKLGLVGWPAVAEEAIIARDIALAKMLGARIHIAHVSTAGSIELIRRGKAEGVKVTAEVTPHHLYFSEDKCSTYDPLFKVNPPLREESDIAALRSALADGTIDIVATDHAPHPAESKEGEFAGAAFGMLGLETAASVVAKVMVESKLIDWNKFFDVMSIKPATLAGYYRHGQKIEKGAVANLTFLKNEEYESSNAKLASKSKNNPFVGEKFNWAVLGTVFNGKLVDWKGSK
jgi:dihydroorotase